MGRQSMCVPAQKLTKGDLIVGGKYKILFYIAKNLNINFFISIYYQNSYFIKL